MFSHVLALIRLARAGYVMAREGVFRGLEIPALPTPARLPARLANLIARRGRAETRARRLTSALERLGPSYVKFGQFLATRPDLVGQQVASDLESLQDRLPPFGLEAARAEIESALGAPVEALFARFDEPLAAASIAQVHRAEITDPGTGETRTVAVKILRPGIERRFQRDVGSFAIAARLVEKFVPAAQRLRPVAVVDTFAESVRFEMDLRLEAAALSELADNIAEDEGFRVPAVDWARSARSVLTTQWVEGRKLSDIAGITEDGHDLDRLAATLIQSFLRHALRDGFFHADMHPGNLFVDPDGLIVAVDCGIMGRLSPKERRFLAEILFGFITRNYTRTAEVHFEAGYVPQSQSVAAFAQALRAIGEPIHGRDASQISMGRLLTQLFEVTDLFHMRTQPQLILLQKTMVVVEGVARTLDARLDIWKTADPVVRDWIARHLGPAGQIEQAAKGARALLNLASDAPQMAARIEALSETLAKDERRPRGAGLALPLWIAALALGILAVKALL
ncbi:MAG: 2-polyprenylphenol 6-hydroxylase [Hyphomicrobiaceae bacterium]|nr:2-polyprenylphenol 6-hydroxylase [Hyphomicrobiaceae bacterium]